MGLLNEYPASASAGTVDGPFDPMLEFVVEFGRLAEVLVDVDGVASSEALSSIIGESLYSFELLPNKEEELLTLESLSEFASVSACLEWASAASFKGLRHTGHVACSSSQGVMQSL